MIKEVYCSFEVAKLLKEKGFDAQCRSAYTNYGQLFTTQIQQYITNIVCSKGNLWECIAPTHQMAMKWLREIYGIDIVIEISDPSVNNRKYYCAIWDKNNDSYILDLFKSYEDAVEAALKYCLENII